MLEVLLREELKNVLAVVTRYFGGVLLGTGGLVRAYTQAVQDGLQAAGVISMQYVSVLQAVTDYNGIGKVKYFLNNEKIDILTEEYLQEVKLQIAVPLEQKEYIFTYLTELTNGRIQLEERECMFRPKQIDK